MTKSSIYFKKRKIALILFSFFCRYKRTNYKPPFDSYKWQKFCRCATSKQPCLLQNLPFDTHKICINIVQVYKLYTHSNNVNYHKTLILYIVV
jgi:hypothetical protein